MLYPKPPSHHPRSDGQNLMSLADLEPGLRSLNLCGFPIPNGNYQVLVQAVGKPTLANQISGAIRYNSACIATTPPPPTTATVTFAASPSTITILGGRTGSFTVTATSQSGTFDSPISLSCAGIPSNLSCSFSPAAITPGSGFATSTLTISTAAVTGSNLPERHNSIPIFAGFLLPFGIGGFALVSTPRRRKAQFFAVIAIVAIGMAGSSCGGGKAVSTQATPAAGSYAVTIHGNASSSQLSTIVNVTVQ